MPARFTYGVLLEKQVWYDTP